MWRTSLKMLRGKLLWVQYQTRHPLILGCFSWTGNAVGEVESVPQDIEYGVDRFDNRVEQGFDNAVYDVEDAPERMAG